MTQGGTAQTDRAAEERGLWERAAAGDAPARDALAALARDVATRELTHSGAPRSELDDLAHDTVLTVLRILDDPDTAPPRHVRAFLKWRARGVLSDHRRKRRPDVVADVPDTRDERPAPLPQELHGALSACRERLGADVSLISLRYDQQLRNVDIAERLGVTANAVGVRIFRALAALRECLQGKGFAVADLTP